MTDQEKMEYLSDRISVLEQIVTRLALEAGAHPPYVKKWRYTVANWPDVSENVTMAAKELGQWARARSPS